MKEASRSIRGAAAGHNWEWFIEEPSREDIASTHKTRTA